MTMMENVGILAAMRTPIGKGIRGVFKNTRPDELGASVVKAGLEKLKLDKNIIEDIIFGCAMPEAEQGMNVARIIGLRANLPVQVSAATVNRFCASGLHAVADIAKAICVGQISMGVGGGVESMSMVPMGGHKPSANPVLMQEYPGAYLPMGVTAERVAEKYKISREEQDKFALQSHERACRAIRNNLFDDEISAVRITEFENQKENFRDIKLDEGPRSETSLELLAKLKPVFLNQGTVTAGNSSQISDGAAAVILMNSIDAKNYGYKTRAYFRAFVSAGVDPEYMGTGPVPAIRKLLKLTGISQENIGVFELNEAFAAQAIYCIRELDLDPEKVNPNGGAIALGHPLGCTGARQVATILNHMERKKLQYGVCSMCVGGGMGAAALIERG